MKLILTCVTLLLSLQILFSQNKIYHNEQNYDATDPFIYYQNAKSKFSLDSDETIILSVGKKGNGGIILLQKTNNSGWDVMIVGNLFIYLSDGSVIKCIDRKIYDYTDNTASALYFLTSSEIEKLKNYDITSLRYSLAINLGQITDTPKNFSADNYDNDTSSAVQELF